MKLIAAHNKILKSILRNYDTRDPEVKKVTPEHPLSPGKIAYVMARRDEASDRILTKARNR